ncbi:gas vesicle protein [Dactylosporangium siamense]|uniref:Gas vesicle protein n=1 Tax=Dactylosporangium siamense TaxID=685454 RepID=A0A919PT42_9ACTN|nr:gas vesicle protein [Dactylosporangium siamense]GIG47963.1 hypothetical protein Dsi01nite_060040 [Dactylosporangium siamense]
MTPPANGTVATPERVALVDLLDRLLSTGVVVTGEVTLSIADVDLVYISLRALIASAGTVAADPPVGRDWAP